MIDQLFDLIPIIKNVLITIGIIGSIVLVAGIYRKERAFITRGAYILVMAIILWVCGYFILTTTIKRADQMIYDAQMGY
ncbi:MAG: hypothetical protein RL662_2211 [Bacteroidota bacterium]|jgi:Ca2+/Na+ antiporter